MGNNFEFFNKVDECSKYAAIGAYAEYYYHNDIRSAYVKLGIISEGLVNRIAAKVSCPDYLETYNEKINWLYENNHITSVVLDLLRYVNTARIYGAHDIVNPKFEATEEKFDVFSSALKAYRYLFVSFFLQSGRKCPEKEFAVPDVVHGENAYLDIEAQLHKALEREEKHLSIITEKDNIIDVQNAAIEHSNTVISEKAGKIKDLESENEWYRNNSDISLSDRERIRLNEFRREEYMKASPVSSLENIIDAKGLPVCVWKENWTVDYYFRVDKIKYDENDRLIAAGKTYNGRGQVSAGVQYFGSVPFHLYCNEDDFLSEGMSYGEIDTAANLYEKYGSPDGEPVIIQKTGWFGDFCFVAEKDTGDSLVGKTYKSGEVYHPQYTLDKNEMCSVYSGIYRDAVLNARAVSSSEDIETDITDEFGLESLELDDSL